MNIYFATTNQFKIREFNRLFRLMKANITLVQYNVAGMFEEPQTTNMEKIVRHKTVAAYKCTRRPVLVDHTGLAMAALGGNLPLGLNALFWHELRGKVCAIAHSLGQPAATLCVYLGFCDGQRIHICEGSSNGSMADRPRPPTPVFNLDAVFIPDNHAKTFGEMRPAERNRVHGYYRRIAAEKMLGVLRSYGEGRR